jgi:hypothetical protein
MSAMFRTGSGLIDAEYAFTRARRASRRAALARSFRLGGTARRLPVHCTSRRPHLPGASGLREIPLSAIAGTLEPSRAKQFDGAFRPVSKAARRRWERVWLAEDRGTVLPPISVVAIGDGQYALVDGHHRVSVAHARGAVAIDATVSAR